MKFEHYDDLEDAVENARITPEALLRSYRDLVLELIDEGIFKHVPDSDLYRIRQYTSQVLHLWETQDQSAMSKIRVELWQLADNSGNDTDVYNLARSVIFLYGRDTDWDTAQDPILFYLLNFLRRIVRDIEPRFVAHFSNTLFPS